MTLTTRSMEWLNQNRRRAYPMEQSEWRMNQSPESGLDAILLDALVVDSDAEGGESLTLESATVTERSTTVVMKYGSEEFSLSIEGGSASGEGSFRCFRGVVRGSGLSGASISLAFSSHAYLLEKIGTGSWSFGCRVLKSRVVLLSDGAGVERIETNGSLYVKDHDRKTDISGEVVLEDGYRTSPIAMNGRVFVRVGRRYGVDPCNYKEGNAGANDCSDPLFFFCGQNAVNSGNVTLRGGIGISVKDGGTYHVNDPASKANGKDVPCIEITAGRDLLDICAPGGSSGESSDSSFG